MTEPKRPEFLSQLLAFLAERRFFPDVGAVDGPVVFTIERDGLSYTVACRSTGRGGRTTVYEIRRPLGVAAPVGDEAGMRAWVHMIRTFAVLEQPFTIGLEASGRPYLSCAGLHQNGAAFDFLALHEVFERLTVNVETAIERLTTLRPNPAEIDGMLVLIRDPNAMEADDAV